MECQADEDADADDDADDVDVQCPGASGCGSESRVT